MFAKLKTNFEQTLIMKIFKQQIILTDIAIGTIVFTIKILQKNLIILR